MGGMDSDSYVESQKNILFEQTFNNTDKYSMTPDQYETLVQKEKDQEIKEKEDKLAGENLKKLEAEIDTQKYQSIVEMVNGNRK